jgi:hypothetical protein
MMAASNRMTGLAVLVVAALSSLSLLAEGEYIYRYNFMPCGALK